MSTRQTTFLSHPSFAKSVKVHIEHLIPFSHKVGAPPCTLVYTWKNEIKPRIKLFQFDKKTTAEQVVEDVDML